MTFVWEAFQFFLSDPLFRTCSKSQWIAGRDGFCLLYLLPLYLLRQPHLLILMAAQFTVTRLRPVLGMKPLVSRPHTPSGKCITLGMWPWKYIVKVYFFINVYGILPPPLQTKPLTGQDGLLLFLAATTLFESLNPVHFTGLAGDSYEQVRLCVPKSSQWLG